MHSGFLCACGLFLTAVSAISAPALPGKEVTSKLISSKTIHGLTIPPGTKATVIADYKKQQVASPTSFAFRSKGEIYIAETHRLRHGVPDNREHLYWYVDDIASRTPCSRRSFETHVAPGTGPADLEIHVIKATEHLAC